MNRRTPTITIAYSPELYPCTSLLAPDVNSSLIKEFADLKAMEALEEQRGEKLTLAVETLL
jgi:hypothetical protein